MWGKMLRKTVAKKKKVLKLKPANPSCEQNIFKLTNETQSTASAVFDKIVEKKRVFIRYIWPDPKKPDVLNICSHEIRKENERFFKR